MTDSVREQIFQNIVTVLKTINGTGSFKTNLGSRVFRYDTAGYDEAAIPFILVYDPTEEYGWLNSSPQLVSVTSRFDLHAKVSGVAEGAVSNSTSKILSDLVHDICLAILTDPKRGGAARETHIESCDSAVFKSADPTGELLMTIRVQYVFRASDPTVPA